LATARSDFAAGQVIRSRFPNLPSRPQAGTGERQLIGLPVLEASGWILLADLSTLPTLSNVHKRPGSRVGGEVPDPLMKKIRVLDKMVDELAKGKAKEKSLRH